MLLPWHRFDRGQDIHPQIYNENQHKHLGYVNSLIDYFQLTLAKIAIKSDMPILGICRGMQIINVANGDSLYQDLPEKSSNILKHVQEGKRYERAHKVALKNDSILGRILGESVMVNSYHHQGVKQLGDDLHTTALSDDDVIEGIEMPDKEFVVGV